jgi:signal transduction histidine kinase
MRRIAARRVGMPIQAFLGRAPAMKPKGAHRLVWAVLLALGALAPIVICAGFVYVQQKTAWMEEVHADLEIRTGLIRALLHASRDPGSNQPAQNLGEGGGDAPLRRAAARLASLANLGPGYKALLFEAGRDEPLAVHNTRPEQGLPFADLARALGPQAKLNGLQTDIAGAPHLVSVEPVWMGGPILVVARDLAASPRRASADEVALLGIASVILSGAALAALLWLFAGRPGGPLEGVAGREKPSSQGANGHAQNGNGLLDLAQAVGASGDRRDRDVLEEKLRRSQVAAAVRQLTDAMADEIGSPLNTILGRARLGAGSPNCPPEIRTALEIIAVQAERISRMVTEMLRVTRPARFPSGVCDLAAITEQVLGVIGPECERAKVPVKLEREADSAYVRVDEERAFQIVVNACLSAVEAQPEGGNVTLRIRAEDHDAGPGKRVLLEVEDQGRPPSEELETAGLSGISSAIDARGFGLMIARGLVVEVGGLFELRAGARGGAVCQFTFPGSGGAPQATPRSSTSSSMEKTT